jgi:hypothetical protein
MAEFSGQRGLGDGQLAVLGLPRRLRLGRAGRVVLDGQVAVRGRRDSDLQPRLLEVELAQDPVHHLV